MSISRTSRRSSTSASRAKQAPRSSRPASATKPAPRKPATAASSFRAATSAARASSQSNPVAARRTDPAREFPDFLTGLGGFTQLQWKPLRETLLDFKAGRIPPTAGGRSDMVPVDARSIRRELDAFLKQPEVQRGLYRDGNIYEVEANFLRKWGLQSRDQVNDLAYRGEPAFLEVPRGQEENPVHAAASQLYAHAAADSKYAALLTRVLEDPLTALMLIRGTSIGASGPRPKAHEQQLAADLHELAFASDQISLGGELERILPGGNEALEKTQRRLKTELQAEQGLRELAQKGGDKQARIERAMTGLSWKKPDFSAL